MSQTAILGICGGIAAYKAVTVASKLRQAGLDVHVVMTAAATRFVTALTFEAVTRNKAVTSNWPAENAKEGEDFFPHLFPASRADVFCVLPATADMIGKLANGYADDIICTAALPLPKSCLRYVCPSMNADMWENEIVVANAAKLRASGWRQLGPETGLLACGDEGFGRLTEPEEIGKQILDDLQAREDLAGKTVMVLSGPTVEPIDPVRYISNHSSGKMGRAVAEELSRRGAKVLFITGPVPPENLPNAANLEKTRVQTAADMLAAAQEVFAAADAAVFVAAVADYRPAETAAKKMPKADHLQLELVRTPDIAATLGAARRADQVCLGFALETHDGEAHARAKLEAKQFKSIILNSPAAMGADKESFRLVTKDDISDWGTISKRDCARRLVDLLRDLLG